MEKSTVKTEICETCDEEEAVKNHSEFGWMCQHCLDELEELEDSEINMDEDLTDDEIEAIARKEEEGEDDDECLDENDLRHEGLMIDRDDY